MYQLAGAKSTDETHSPGIPTESQDILDSIVQVNLLQPDLLLRLRAPLTFLNFISAAVFAFNFYIVPGQHSFVLPVELFAASTVVLGILLAHRLKAANDRFLRVREAWNDIVSVTRNVNREAHLQVDRDSFVVLSQWLPAFPAALLWQLRDMDLKDLEPLLKNLKVLTEKEINQVLTRPPGKSAADYVLQKVQAVTSKLQLPAEQEQSLQLQLSRLQHAQRRCEAEKDQAVPQVLQRSAGLLFLWLASLPFILPTQQLGIVLVQQLLAFGLLGIEDVAIQLEEPFVILQMEGPCVTLTAECQALRNNWRRMRKGLEQPRFRETPRKYPVAYPRNDRIFPCYPEEEEAGDDDVILL